MGFDPTGMTDVLGLASVASAAEAGVWAGEAGITTAASTAASVLSAAGTAAQLAGGVVGGIWAINSAEANANAAKYQAQVAANNQQRATQKAGQEAASGAANTEQALLRTREIVGAEKAAQAASNIDVNTGSALDVRSSSAALGQLDALTIRANAARQAYGYETAATSYGGQQQLYQAEAANAPVAGGISALTSVLSGASGAARQYQAWQNVGGNTGGTGGAAVINYSSSTMAVSSAPPIASGEGCVVASGTPAGTKPLSPPLLSSVCWHPARREWPHPQYARDRQWAMNSIVDTYAAGYNAGYKWTEHGNLQDVRSRVLVLVSRRRAGPKNTLYGTMSYNVVKSGVATIMPALTRMVGPTSHARRCRLDCDEKADISAVLAVSYGWRAGSSTPASGGRGRWAMHLH